MTQVGRKAQNLACLGAALFAFSVAPSPAASQSGPEDMSAELLRHFENSMRKVHALAEAMPEDLYGWSPGEGVMPVAEVYAHITHYNFMYLADNLGVPSPAGLELDQIEGITDKSAILDLMVQSIEHVTTAVSAMDEGELASSTVLYGRDVASWAVLVQLVAHMNEHLGQSIAYARMNDITPPWAR